MMCFTASPPRFILSVVLLLLACAVPLQAEEPNEAEKLFLDMQKKLSGVKTLEWKFTGTQETIANGERLSDGARTFQGALLLAEGNKCNLQVSVTLKPENKTSEWFAISDGTALRATTGTFFDAGTSTKLRATPRNLNAQLLAAITHSGLVHADLLQERYGTNKDGKVGKTDQPFEAASFSLGPKEKLGEQEAQVIHYHLTNAYPPLRVSLWLDVKTHLPLQRVVVWSGVAGDHTTTERYATLTLDGTVDPKRFALPQE